MGTFGVLVRLFALAVILTVSFLLTEAIISFGSSTPELLGAAPVRTSPVGQLSGGLLEIASAVFVGVLFTAPLALSMFGHAGAWIKHVAAKSAKYLSIALVFALALDIAAAGTPGIGDPSPGLLVISALAGGVLLLTLASPSTLLGAASGAMDVARASVGFRRERRSSLAAVELQVSPTAHVRGKERPERVRTEAIKFQRLVQALVALVGRVELRLSFREGRGRILVLARGAMGREELQERLLGVVKAHLPEFSAKACEVPERSQQAWHSVTLVGVPEAAENPLEPLSRYFLENGYSGDYQVTLGRAWVNPLQKLLSRRGQKAIAQRADGQKTESTLQGEQQTSSVRDYIEQVKLEEAVKLVERHQSSLVLKCWVRVTGLGEGADAARRVAEGASSVLVGSLSSHRSISALKTTSSRQRVDRLEPKGNHVLLLPAEAVPYAWIPQVALGTRVAPSAEFELPPKLEGEVELGQIVVHSSPTGHEARIPLDVLTKHCFITGMTGSGKTTSCFNLLMQLYRLGIPFLVVEPVKSEYRSLLTQIPSLQVFTVGDEDAAPFRLNIFEPPPGVKVQTHAENLEAAWNASFVQYAPLPYVVKEVLSQTYKACGWDLRTNARGKPITFEDLRATAERVTRRLGYEPKVTMDIEAALMTRIRSMTLGGKGPLFNTVASIPLEDVLRRPTVVELRSIANSEEKAFVAALLLMNLLEYRETQGNSRQLRHLTLVEEAHRLLPNISTAKGDPEGADPRKRMVEQFADMLAEVRAYGEGLAIVEQIPTKILPDAVKNTATKVAHRLPSADDREVLAGAMNLTKPQAAVFAALSPGEAILSVEGHPLPVRLQVPDVIRKFGVPVGEVDDEEVKRHMTEFYLKNPLPRAPASYFDDSILPMVDSDWFKAKFMEAYRAWLKTGATEPLAGLVFEGASKFARDEEGRFELAIKVLSLAVQFYLPLDEQQRARFPRLFMQEVQRKRRSQGAEGHG
ncbi:MAG: DUF87 domain-containing protein [Thaumarchaeota archaeon]|nr:DUF87 domain-containing protein [Nitrososphaerota archaeon]